MYFRFFNFLLLLFFLVNTISCIQSNKNNNLTQDDPAFATFKTQYLTLDYPADWEIQKSKDRLIFYLQDSIRDFASPSFTLTFHKISHQRNYQRQLNYLKDFPDPEKEYFLEKIAGKEALANRSTGGSTIKNNRYWLEVAPDTDAIIHIAGYPEHITQHNSLFKKVISSIKLIPQPTAAKSHIIEVSNKQLAKEWQVDNIPFGPPPGFTISKFQETIRKISMGTTTLRITDDGTEITDWESFFAWKPFSVVKDVPIYGYIKWPDKQLRIFNQLDLSSYDYLMIKKSGANKLTFNFTKNSGEQIKWILTYEREHTFPLNKKIDLNRFNHQTGAEFKYAKAKTSKTGKIVTFAINSKKHTLRLQEMIVI